MAAGWNVNSIKYQQKTETIDQILDCFLRKGSRKLENDGYEGRTITCVKTRMSAQERGKS